MLKRKHARVCIVLLMLAVVIGFLPLVVLGVLRTDMGSWAKWCFISGLVCAGLATIIRLNCLRCQNCGEGLAGVRWGTGKDGYCPRCGKPFIFDDDPGDEKRDGM